MNLLFWRRNFKRKATRKLYYKTSFYSVSLINGCFRCYFSLVLFHFFQGQTFESSSSRYTVHKPSKYGDQRTWNQSLYLCLRDNSELVSIEDENEFMFLKGKLKPEIEYFIGLRKSSGKWTWISNDSIEVEPYKDPWASEHHPNDNDAYCAKMYYKTTKFVYDDIRCNAVPASKVGYICEKHVGCQNEKGMRQIVYI